ENALTDRIFTRKDLPRQSFISPLRHPLNGSYLENRKCARCARESPGSEKKTSAHNAKIGLRPPEIRHARPTDRKPAGQRFPANGRSPLRGTSLDAAERRTMGRCCRRSSPSP